METITYKGIEIEIRREEWVQNPFEDWDCLHPLMAKYDGTLTDYSKGDITDYLSGFLTYNQTKRYQKRLLKMMDESIEDFMEDYPSGEYDRTDMVQEYLDEWLTDRYDNFKNMATFCEEFNIPYLSTYTRGYSQGDHIDLFICCTKKFEEVTGCTEHTKKDIQSSADIYGYWAWGDVYWYSIEETGDSCGGFYGNDHEKSGLMEMARSSIDHYLIEKKIRKQSRLKSLVKANVPLEYRQKELSNY